MPHKPPVPKEAVSPFPLHADQTAERMTAKHDLAEQTASNLNVEDNGHGVRIAVGAAIGSAAIVAALLYYNRKSSVSQQS